jgi:hypothetical protein
MEKTMHRSRLSTIVIDCKDGDLAQAAAFWARALGRRAARAPKNPAHKNYRRLGSGREDLIVLLQRVGHPSRVHLDIEADDIEREAARLERLGARRVKKIKTWWVMEAPTGHRFCVVRPQRGPLGKDANRWR